KDGIRGFHVTGVQTCALPICTGFQVPEASTRDRRVVHEHVRAATVNGDEPETLLRVEPLHGALSHLLSLGDYNGTALCWSRVAERPSPGVATQSTSAHVSSARRLGHPKLQPQPALTLPAANPECAETQAAISGEKSEFARVAFLTFAGRWFCAREHPAAGRPRRRRISPRRCRRSRWGTTSGPPTPRAGSSRRSTPGTGRRSSR